MNLKSFKNFITESPYPNVKVDGQDIKSVRSSTENFITKNHEHSTKVSNTPEGTIHKINDRENTYYYHHVNGNPREFSEFDDEHNQIYTDKNGGNSKYNKEFLYHHANENGIAKSDSNHSKGGEKLWRDIIKTPKAGFSVYHKGIKITPDNLTKKEKDIWNNKVEDEDDKRLELRKD